MNGVDLGGETVGLITYMRTDGVTMAAEAVHAIRDMIGSSYGAPYLPEKTARLYQQGQKCAGSA